MNDAETSAPRLWTPEGFREDEWSRAENLDAPAGNGRLILPLAAFLALDDDTRARHEGRIGVHVLPGEAIDPLVPHLGALPLVCLAFPAFNDGRSYSKAALLRGHHGYRGAIRACGDVLIDQVPLMLRAGFSEFEVANETALRRLAEGRSGGLGLHYQPAATEDRRDARYSWRRHAAA